MHNPRTGVVTADDKLLILSGLSLEVQCSNTFFYLLFYFKDYKHHFLSCVWKIVLFWKQFGMD
jgi:hypothetical protein